MRALSCIVAGVAAIGLLTSAIKDAPGRQTGTPGLSSAQREAAERTIQRLDRATTERHADDLCDLVLALKHQAPPGSCASAVSAMWVRTFSHVQRRVTNLAVQGNLVRADIEADIGDRADHFTVREVIWLERSRLDRVLTPSRVLSLAFGQDDDDASVDAKPLEAAELARRAAGTGTHPRCSSPTLLGEAADRPADVDTDVGGRAINQHARRGFDLRTVRLVRCAEQTTDLLLRFAGPVRPGLHLTFALSQRRLKIDTHRSLLRATAQLGTTGQTSVGQYPRDMVVSVRGSAIIATFRPGALNAFRPWKLWVAAQATDPSQPLLTDALSANDEAFVKPRPRPTP